MFATQIIYAPQVFLEMEMFLLLAATCRENKEPRTAWTRTMRPQNKSRIIIRTSYTHMRPCARKRYDARIELNELKNRCEERD